ncbi:MAG: hypothetical protein JSS93_04250, partial [Bacteroidetes bacterium]|nr:hypothetical protein [Bacteroidota bacterium]
LTQNSWTRDNTRNNFLYNEGSELNTTTGLYDLPFRNYDAALKLLVKNTNNGRGCWAMYFSGGL